MKSTKSNNQFLIQIQKSNLQRPDGHGAPSNPVRRGTRGGPILVRRPLTESEHHTMKQGIHPEYVRRTSAAPAATRS
jgi:hypothetical protein